MLLLPDALQEPLFQEPLRMALPKTFTTEKDAEDAEGQSRKVQDSSSVSSVSSAVKFSFLRHAPRP